jgi:hypothetical protein
MKGFIIFLLVVILMVSVYLMFIKKRKNKKHKRCHPKSCKTVPIPQYAAAEFEKIMQSVKDGNKNDLDVANLAPYAIYQIVNKKDLPQESYDTIMDSLHAVSSKGTGDDCDKYYSCLYNTLKSLNPKKMKASMLKASGPVNQNCNAGTCVIPNPPYGESEYKRIMNSSYPVFSNDLNIDISNLAPYAISQTVAKASFSTYDYNAIMQALSQTMNFGYNDQQGEDCDKYFNCLYNAMASLQGGSGSSNNDDSGDDDSGDDDYDYSGYNDYPYSPYGPSSGPSPSSNSVTVECNNLHMATCNVLDDTSNPLYQQYLNCYTNTLKGYSHAGFNKNNCLEQCIQGSIGYPTCKGICKAGCENAYQ